MSEVGGPALFISEAVGERDLDLLAVDVKCLNRGDEGLVGIHFDLQS